MVQEVGGLSGNVSAAVELVLCQGHDPEHPLFSTLPPAVYSETHLLAVDNTCVHSCRQDDSKNNCVGIAIFCECRFLFRRSVPDLQ